MPLKYTCCLICLLIAFTGFSASDTTISFRFRTDVTITIDKPAVQSHKNTQLILFALPNGNTTAQTMGKKMEPGDDWHYDIQHIKAQTAFIRETSKENIIVAYLENDKKAWPTWKRSHTDYPVQITAILDTIVQLLALKHYTLHLNGHSGGGSFIFGYLDAVHQIPDIVRRITFIDSNYGYDSSYTNKFRQWLSNNRKNFLTVFAYNDSIALYNDKPIVSATGGTWYRSKLMIKDLQDLQFKVKDDSIMHFQSKNKRMNVYLKKNPDRKIYHTQQVEYNGFIHSVLIGTAAENRRYRYYGDRAFSHLIQ
ncbi:MAG: hypothetical protein ACK4S0_03445 [Sediminibacterium sp.]